MEKRSYITLAFSFHIQAYASLDLKSDAEKELSCWLKSVVVGESNSKQLISHREAAKLV